METSQRVPDAWNNNKQTALQGENNGDGLPKQADVAASTAWSRALGSCVVSAGKQWDGLFFCCFLRAFESWLRDILDPPC